MLFQHTVLIINAVPINTVPINNTVLNNTVPIDKGLHLEILEIYIACLAQLSKFINSEPTGA